MRIPALMKCAVIAVPAMMLTQAIPATEAAQPEPATTVGVQTRAELLAARDRAWRAFFSEDPARLEKLLGPELIAIQQGQEAWEDRDRLVAMAHAIRKHGVRIERLEFPRTEVQIFGDVAILYYSYVFETTDGKWSVTDTGRGTEIFVRRGGRWVDVGWHLDHGAFVRRGDAWVRLPSGNAPQSAAQ